MPPAAPFLLPVAAARLARASFTASGLFTSFLIPALVLPASLLLGVLLVPGGGWIAAILGVALVALPAVALFAGTEAGRRRDRLFLLVFAATGIGALAVLLGFGLSTGRDPGAALGARWAALVPEILGTYRSMGWSESSLSAAGRLFDLIRTALTEQLPGLVLCASALYAALLVYPLAAVAFLPVASLSEPSFSRFTTPAAAAVLFVPAGLLAALGGPDVRRPAVDLLLPVAALFFLRGLAIIRALLDRARAGLVGRALVYALAFQMPFPVILALGGLFDEFLDIRGRLARPDPKEP